MNRVRPKKPRLRLDTSAYQELCLQVLERDKWRCQNCGGMRQLQVHHQQFRSQAGDDAEENLITLCESCHKMLHANVDF
jgi:5-methylcytosine-specific restriction endonuclease McrA